MSHWILQVRRVFRGGGGWILEHLLQLQVVHLWWISVATSHNEQTKNPTTNRWLNLRVTIGLDSREAQVGEILSHPYIYNFFPEGCFVFCVCDWKTGRTPGGKLHWWNSFYWKRRKEFFLFPRWINNIHTSYLSFWDYTRFIVTVEPNDDWIGVETFDFAY